ncbi:MAG TPA: CopG family transcriptional regulator [Candidatus Limnocylindrales bacterium]|nr:CopG family transcriptional regulator [Candidatus Limnocylindrales bacterium]
MSMRRFNMYIEVKTDVALEDAARAEGVSKAELIRRFIARGLDRSSNPEPDPIDALVGDLEGEAGDIDAAVYGT